MTIEINDQILPNKFVYRKNPISKKKEQKSIEQALA
jgi:hypothetical protein